MHLRHLVTIGFLLASLALYYIGLDSGATALFVAGMVCELVFWKRLFSRKPA
jgi:hypothetical protein